MASSNREREKYVVTRMDEAEPDLTPQSPDARVRRAVYNKASGKTIVEVESCRGDRCHRVYWKENGEAFYQKLGNPAAGDSFEFITTGTEPLLYLCLRTWVNSTRGSFVDIYYQGILQVDLRAHPVVTPLPLEDILPAGTKIHSILRVDEAGKRLLATITSEVFTRLRRC